MILICAATGTEAAACQRGIAAAGEEGFEVLGTGVGPDRAAAALRRWLAMEDPLTHAVPGPSAPPLPEWERAGVRGGGHRRPDLIVSAGFAGALTPDLEPLAWITASAVLRCVDGRLVPVPLPPGLLRTLDGAAACHVVSAERVLAAGLSGLPRPTAVDMESAALAEVAGAAGIPFAVLRMVTDTPARPLSPVGRLLADAFSAEDLGDRAAHAGRAALAALRAPAHTLAFLRDGVRWRALLRDAWRGRARASAQRATGP